MLRQPALSLHQFSASRFRAVCWLLLLAVFARGLVAPGFMPHFGDQGVSIVLCTPQGAKTVWKADDMAGQHQASGEHCAFGQALGMASLPAAPPALPYFEQTDRPAALPAAIASNAVSLGYSARGPPALLS